MKLIALINSCQQFSPDDWENKPRILEIRPETTIAELIKWHNKERSVDDGELKRGQIHILEAENEPLSI